MFGAPFPWRPEAAIAGRAGAWPWAGPWPGGNGTARAPVSRRASSGLLARLARWAGEAWRGGAIVAHASHPAAADAAPAAERRPLSAAEAARFREIMLPHLDDAYTLARYLCRDADAAGDVVQDAYLRAYRAFPGFKGASARAWLLAIVRNCHLTWRDQIRRERMRHAPGPSAGDAGDDEAAPAPAAVDLLADGATPESLLLQRAEADAVRALLQQLPEALREVLVLRELEELSYREIADVIGAPVGTVMSRLSRARRAFATLWDSGPGGAAVGDGAGIGAEDRP